VTRANRKAHPGAPHQLGRLVAAALVVALAASGDAQATAPKGFVGAVLPFGSRCATLDRGINCLTDRDLRRMQEADVGIVRWGLRWSRVQPLRFLSPNWRATDAVIGSLARRGIRVLPVLNGTPRWAVGTPGTPPLDSRMAREGWRQFVAASVQQYGPGGEYWASRYQRQFPGGPARPITTWQVWNEQNLRRTFPPRPSPRRYARLLRITHDAVTAQDPQAKILLGGMPGFTDQLRSWEYLERLCRQPGVRSDFDAVALHPYAPDLRHVTVQIKRARRVMQAHHDGRSPVWITELGWGSDPPDSFGTNAGILGQSRMIERALPRLIRERHRWRLQRVLWYAWRDPPPSSGRCSFCESAGLFWHNQEPKPAWQAFMRIMNASP
jgi:hypothetical protein